MLSVGKASQGKHGRGEEVNRLSHDAVKLLKTQDAGYLRTVAGKGRRELEKLEQVVGLEGVLSSEGRKQMGRKKVVFVDGEGGEQEGKNARKRKLSEMDGENGADDMDTDNHTKEGNTSSTAEMNDQNQSNAATPAKPKSKKALQAEQQAKLDLRAIRRRRKRLGELRAAKLEALKKRQKEVMAAAEQMELQRAKMSRTVGGVNKDGVKWKIRERKR
jgi:U3 small nucleolar RNA-associated protein 11